MTAALVLASASRARRALLAQAGLEFSVQPADIDETAILRGLQGKIPAEEIALELARRKVLAVAQDQSGALVIGADQILIRNGRLYQKAESLAAARMNLQTLRDGPHQLISAVCVARGNDVLWRHAATAQLTMKAFDDAFIDRYLAAVGDVALRTVGGYELEGLGAWLFDKVEGDYFTILGLPLLPLLDFLATQGFGP